MTGCYFSSREFCRIDTSVEAKRYLWLILRCCSRFFSSIQLTFLQPLAILRQVALGCGEYKWGAYSSNENRCSKNPIWLFSIVKFQLYVWRNLVCAARWNQKAWSMICVSALVSWEIRPLVQMVWIANEYDLFFGAASVDLPVACFCPLRSWQWLPGELAPYSCQLVKADQLLVLHIVILTCFEEECVFCLCSHQKHPLISDLLFWR